MTDVRTGSGLSTIFGFFLGLMVAACVGVGVYTFYPPPGEPFDSRIRTLGRERLAIERGKAPDQLTADDRARLQAISDEQDALQDQHAAASRGWGRVTAVVLVGLATAIMAVAVLRAAQLPVVTNGLLLGGLFTMVYGVGWIVTTDTTLARFAVISAALAITLGLGYLRFVRGAAVTGTGPAGTAAEAGTPGLEARVRRLEERLDDVARALQPRDR